MVVPDTVFVDSSIELVQAESELVQYGLHVIEYFVVKDIGNVISMFLASCLPIETVFVSFPKIIIVLLLITNSKICKYI